MKLCKLVLSFAVTSDTIHIKGAFEKLEIFPFLDIKETVITYSLFK
jgi:hypothetical protein